MNGAVLLPTAIVGLAFLLKLVVDRTAAVPDMVLALLELPVDIAFLALSFLAGAVISMPTAAADGLVLFIGYVVGSVLVVVLWRRSHRAFLEERWRHTTVQALLNYVLCVTALVVAIRVLTSGSSNG